MKSLWLCVVGLLCASEGLSNEQKGDVPSEPAGAEAVEPWSAGLIGGLGLGTASVTVKVNDEDETGGPFGSFKGGPWLQMDLLGYRWESGWTLSLSFGSARDKAESGEIVYDRSVSSGGLRLDYDVWTTDVNAKPAKLRVGLGLGSVGFTAREKSSEVISANGSGTEFVVGMDVRMGEHWGLTSALKAFSGTASRFESDRFEVEEGTKVRIAGAGIHVGVLYFVPLK